MAQTGYTPIQLYYSTTASAVPVAGNLAAGELAINTLDGKLYYKNSAGTVTLLASTAGASGDVVGPSSATDNALVRFDATTGKLIQNSVGILSDAGVLTGLTGLTSSGAITLSSLTSGRVTYAGTAGLLQDSANLLFDGTTLTANALTVTNAVTLSGGTANGITYLNGSKVLTSGSALTFDGTDLLLASGGLLDIDSTNAAVAMRIRQTTAGSGTEFTTTITENTGVIFDSSDSGGTIARNFIWNAAGTEEMRLSSTGLTVNYANPSSGGSIFALNTTTPTEVFDINTNDDYGQFTAALGGSPYLALRFAKGDLSAKTTLVSGDTQNIVFQGYDGASFINMARMSVVAAATVSSGVVPGRIAFETASAGSVLPAFHIDQNQYCTIGPATVGNVPLYISKTASSAIEAAIYVYPSATPTNSSHILFNSSGSGAAIFGRTNSAGVIQGFTSGSNYSTVLGNTGALPFYFINNNTHAMNISSGQFVTVSNTSSTGSAPLSVVTPAASAAGFMFEVNPATSTNASVLYINNAGAGSLYLGRASSAGTGAPVAMNAAESFMIHSGTQRLVLGSNSLRALIIDSSGYVTTPYQVSFNVYASASLTGAQTPVVFNTVRHNKGSGYSTSTGRFTAPVDGTYFFSVTNNMIQANGADALLRKNGSNIIGVEYDPAGSGLWLGLTVTTILELVAGDYIDYITGAGSSYTVEGTPWNNFVGYLLG